MAHLWVHEAGEQPDGGGWAAVPLVGDERRVGAALALRRATDGWVALGAPSAHVNGVALATGLRVLADRDELRAGGARAFFSTESLATVTTFPGAEGAVFCPRCKLEIAPQSPAVRCPQCAVWHHQDAELPCFTYAACCTLCDQPTALDAGFRWTPEAL